MFQEMQQPWPPPERATVCSTPFDFCLTDRMRDILVADMHRHPAGTFDFRVASLGQSICRQPKFSGKFPCITPRMDLWCRKRGRPVFGIELLAVQGLDATMIVTTEGFSNTLLKDMAGKPGEETLTNIHRASPPQPCIHFPGRPYPGVCGSVVG